MSRLTAAVPVGPRPSTAAVPGTVRRGGETLIVWNPVDDPNRKTRWTYFRYPKFDLYKNDPKTTYNMCVVQHDPELGVRNRELYFFANHVAWCLGHEMPHEAVHVMIPAENRHEIDFGYGTFLTREGVYDFVSKTSGKDEVFFKDWFDRYLAVCEPNVVYDVFTDLPT